MWNQEPARGDDPHQNSKSQTLKVCDGKVLCDPPLSEQLRIVNTDIARMEASGYADEPPPQQDDQFSRALSAGQRTNSERADGKPKWLKYSTETLRFWAYFSEQDERTRLCTVLYYLSDDTLQINEPKTEEIGSGGTLLNRHRIKGPDGDYVAVRDLQLGSTLDAYGRKIKLCRCDAFTENFYAENGIPLGTPEDLPELKSVKEAPRLCRVTKSMPQDARYALPKISDPDSQRVLRFYCHWDPPHDQRRFFALHYYLCDGTTEFAEKHQEKHKLSYAVFVKWGPSRS
eukprot:GHVU01036928.1.p1 GENE.GHVU01036928.1~~GHVU01036928.1.p1  ORF type:complete len:287 (-),score=28.49 GHVU01036928.1:1045-1905(-)